MELLTSANSQKTSDAIVFSIFFWLAEKNRWVAKKSNQKIHHSGKNLGPRWSQRTSLVRWGKKGIPSRKISCIIPFKQSKRGQFLAPHPTKKKVPKNQDNLSSFSETYQDDSIESRSGIFSLAHLGGYLLKQLFQQKRRAFLCQTGLAGLQKSSRGVGWVGVRKKKRWYLGGNHGPAWNCWCGIFFHGEQNLGICLVGESFLRIRSHGIHCH